MERTDVQSLLAMIQATYPNFNPPSKTAAINAWLIALEEYGKNEVAMAFKAYIQSDTKGFPPAPGQIIDKIQLLTRPSELNDMEAWAIVSKALRNGYYGAEDEFERLPLLVQKAVGSASNLRQWSQTDSESIENVIQSNFLRNYRTVVARERQISSLSNDLKKAIENVNKSDKLLAKESREIEEIEERHESVPMPEYIKEKVKMI